MYNGQEEDELYADQLWYLYIESRDKHGENDLKTRGRLQRWKEQVKLIEDKKQAEKEG